MNLRKIYDERRSLIEEARRAYDEPEGTERDAKVARLEERISVLSAKLENGLDAADLDARAIAAFDTAPHTEPTVEARNFGLDHDVEALRSFARGEGGKALEFAPLTAEQRSLVKGTASAGGNLVPTTMYDQIVVQLRDLSTVLAANATVINTASGEALQIPQSGNWSAAAIVAEGGSIGISEPSFAQTSLGAYKYALLGQVSPELLADSSFNVESYFAEQAGDALAQGMGAHFVTGTGTGQPQGLITGASIGKTTAAIAAVTTDEIIDLYHSVLRPYRREGVFMFGDSSLAAIRKLKDGTNQYLWQPGLALGQPDTILGRPVLTDPAIASMATGALFGGFGNVKKAYLVRMVGGVRVERSNDFAFQTDLVTWKFVARADAKVVDSAAFKTIKNA